MKDEIIRNVYGLVFFGKVDFLRLIVLTIINLVESMEGNR